MTIKQTVEKYMSDVMSGEIVACKWEKLAVKRHLDDLKRPDFPYHFDEQRAEHPIQFIHNYCVHVKGSLGGKPLMLSPWQLFITWVIFGWVDDEDWRRFDTVFIEVAKKNGKSTWMAAIALYLTLYDGEAGAEVYSVATAKDQARIVFNDYAKAMIKKSDDLKQVFTAYAQSITDTETETNIFKALASDRDRLDGKNVHGAVVDEYHAHKTTGVYRAMVDGTSARDQPMVLIITTAGYDPDVPCVDEEDYTKRILQRKAVNEKYFGIVFTLDEGDDWTDKDLWRKPNPNLGISKKQKKLDGDFSKALTITSEQSEFKVKNLNMWQRNRYTWIKDEDWEALECELDLEEMEGAKAYAGIDLASTLDTTSYSLCIPWEDKFRLITKVFLPEEDIKEREKIERFDWQDYADAGHCILTPGRVTDYDFIQVELEKDMARFDILEIAYDKHNASQFISNLIKLGWDEYLIDFSQGWQMISPACKDFGIKVTKKELEVQRNPVVAWEVSNTEVKTDANGNIRPVKPDRRKSRKHIDATLSQVMALDRAVRNANAGSVYDTGGIKRVG
jgi:phage terminase large subunit-like protein